MRPDDNTISQTLFSWLWFLGIVFWDVIKWLFRYSGLEFISYKFRSKDTPAPLQIGLIWVLGEYLRSCWGGLEIRHL